MATEINGTALAVRDDTQSTAIANHEAASSALSHILGTGDLAQLTDDQRVGHYLDVCASLGLNPRTRPFDWIEFYDPETRGKKLTLYPNRSCAEQLRRQHQISVRVVRREPVGELFVVEVEGTTPTGRVGTATKYVSVQDRQGARLRGTQLANAYMKAETGAFRRLTFSMVGMASPPDMDELTRPKVVVVDGSGRVLENPTDTQKALAADPGMAAAIGEPTFESVGGQRVVPGGAVGQAVTAAEVERPEQPRRQVSLHCDADKWRASYFGAVADTALETTAGRRDFMRGYTANFTPALRTNSLSEFLARATDRQAEDMVAVARQAAQAIRDEAGAGDEEEEALAALAAARADEALAQEDRNEQMEF